ncbi:anhydro-N-acetylmuramic acid kinase [Brachybacterium sp. JHP9]|uniref:Anhydro-N-acetylmuramic acid kinase n=1 Tax=Brachybacterium equifaecis TaxID=2910770 RepID=A0ABT0QXH8_9MICO|nr:anhydro-N-acetylmuramic acid kinase [Brachybacterium equifaecis]MCL6422362.1 anhydro-N-acetylmuramic acid kinase [Brachybacterium equifaecis]
MRILGMMSGTSIDGIDTALVEFTRDPADPSVLHAALLDAAEHEWPDDLRRDLLAVLPTGEAAPVGPAAVGAPAATAQDGAASGPVDPGGPAQWTRLHAAVGEEFANAAAEVLERCGAADLIVSHGQTLFHWIDETGAARGTLQIGDSARIAAATSTPVLHDVRAADVAAGGQGAPLAPVLDVLLAGGERVAFLNLGGIANVTLIGADGSVRAGDTGPANCLLDAAVHAATGGARSADIDGALARAGRVDQEVLGALLAVPFYARPLPRSTGREHFDAGYVLRRAPGAADLRLEDLAATLTELTARTVADAIVGAGAGAGGAASERTPAAVARVVGSGGGMRNPALRERLAAHLDPIPLVTSEEIGVPPDAKEALLMALIGYLSAHGLPAVPRADPCTGSQRTVTGARRPVVLGSLAPPIPLAAGEPGESLHFVPVRALRVHPVAPQSTPPGGSR